MTAPMAQDQTPDEPSPDPPAGTADGHGLHQPGDLSDETHGPDDHGETHGHDDHAHAGDALGPVDRRAWGALALGVGAGLLVALCLVIAIAVAPA